MSSSWKNQKNQMKFIGHNLVILAQKQQHASGHCFYLRQKKKKQPRGHRRMPRCLNLVLFLVLSPPVTQRSAPELFTHFVVHLSSHPSSTSRTSPFISFFSSADQAVYGCRSVTVSYWYRPHPDKEQFMHTHLRQKLLYSSLQHEIWSAATRGHH